MAQQHYDDISSFAMGRLDARLDVLTVSAYQLGAKLNSAAPLYLQGTKWDARCQGFC
jgi:hypothetical protein